MGWYDEVRVWNTTFPLMCLKSMSLKAGERTEIWLPDVAIVTDDVFYALPKSNQYPIRLHSNGKVEFSPGGFIRFQCKLNLNAFPFDTMECLGRIEAWFYKTTHQTFDKTVSGFFLYNFTEHEQWRLELSSFDFEDVKYESINGFGIFNTINYRLTLSRKSAYYLVNIIIPSIIISTLECFTFFLPPNQTIRIEVSFICLLAYTMFQSQIQADLPKSADQTPLLSVFITLMIGFIAIAISFQCFVLAMTQKAYLGSQIPNFLFQFLKARFEVADNGVEAKGEKKEDEHSVTLEDEQIELEVEEHLGHGQAPELVSKNRQTSRKIWTFLFKKLDLIAVIVYVACVLGTCIAILAVIPAASD